MIDEINDNATNMDELLFLIPVMFFLTIPILLVSWLLSLFGVNKNDNDISIRKQERKYRKQERKIMKQYK